MFLGISLPYGERVRSHAVKKKQIMEDSAAVTAIIVKGSQLSANDSSTYRHFFPFLILPFSQTLYLHIPVSRHSLVNGRGHLKLKLDFSFVFALS